MLMYYFNVRDLWILSRLYFNFRWVAARVIIVVTYVSIYTYVPGKYDGYIVINDKLNIRYVWASIFFYNMTNIILVQSLSFKHLLKQ